MTDSLAILSEDNNPEIRCEVIRLLAMSGDTGRINFLLTNLSETLAKEVRKEAITALGVIKDKRGIEPLTRNYQDVGRGR